MSSEEPIRSVPDELFRQATAKPERQLPDALFGPAPTPRAEEPKRSASSSRSEEPIRSVPDELFKQVTAKAQRQLPDALFGGPVAPKPVAAEDAGRGSDSDVEAADESSRGSEGASDTTADSSDESVSSPEVASADAELAVSEQDSAAENLGSEGDSAPVGISVVDGPEAGQSIAPAVSSSPESDASEGGTDTAAPSAPAEANASPAFPEGGATATADDATATVDPGAPGQSVPVSADVAASTAEPSVDTAASVGVSAASASPADSATAVPAENEQTASADGPAPRPVLLVVADSLAYFGPKGGLPADHPKIWPNLVAAELDWDVELVGRIGWTCRDAYWALIGDPRIWASVPKAGAVVFAVGGMDTLPSPLPTALRELIRYVRPAWLRRVVRGTYNWLQPKLAKLGRPVALPPRISVDYLDQSREALAQLRPELPFVAVLPSVHNCDAYGRVHRGRPRAVKALQAWSERTSVPLVDLGEAVRDNIFSGDANPDGIHWGWAGHSAVANAMVKTLQEVR
ncbi:SGNH/GDSL hydrolase family protein [Nocardia sp. NBC_01377]